MIETNKAVAPCWTRENDAALIGYVANSPFSINEISTRLGLNRDDVAQRIVTLIEFDKKTIECVRAMPSTLYGVPFAKAVQLVSRQLNHSFSAQGAKHHTAKKDVHA